MEKVDCLFSDEESDLENYTNDLQDELDELLNYSTEEEEEVFEEDNSAFDVDLQQTKESQLTNLNEDIKALFMHQGETVLYLTAEESNVINHCDDLELKKVLVLNRLRKRQLQIMHQKLLEVETKFFKTFPKKKVNNNRNYINLYKLGMPYFKNRIYVPAPDNPDITKDGKTRAMHMLRFKESRRWSEVDQMALRNGIEISYYNYYEKHLKEKISILRFENKKIDDTSFEGATEIKLEYEKQLEILQIEYDQLLLQKPRKTPPYNCDDGIDWFYVANYDLKNKHTINGCKAMWHKYLHPQINKQDWTNEENTKILELVETNPDHDWDSIAEQLNTNRSGYLVCIHYYMKLCDKFQRARFTPEEDEQLLELVNDSCLGSYIPWNKIARHFEHRSKYQLYYRYYYYLRTKEIVKKGTFTEAEDVLLLYLIRKFGENYERFVEYMPHRTKLQLRNRYQIYLNPNYVRHKAYTDVENVRILEYVKENGASCWSNLSRELRRPRSHVRQRYKTLKKALDDPTKSIKDIKSRSLHLSVENKAKREKRISLLLNQIEDLEKVPKLEEIELLLKKDKGFRGRKKGHSQMDAKLIEFFKTTCKTRTKDFYKDQDEPLNDSADRILKLFQVFNADTNIIKQLELDTCENTFFSEREIDVLKTLQDVVEEQERKANTSMNLSLPSTSTFSFFSNQKFRTEKQYVFPPNGSTVLGLRGLLIKFQLFKTVNGNKQSKSKSNATAMEVEVTMQESDKTLTDNEQRLFFDRFYILFRWASILSTYFPKDLNINLEEELATPMIVKKKVGRPSKPVHWKIDRMNAARLRLTQFRNSRDSSDVNNDSMPSTSSAAAPRTQKEEPKTLSKILRRASKDGTKKPKLIDTDVILQDEALRERTTVVIYPISDENIWEELSDNLHKATPEEDNATMETTAKESTNIIPKVSDRVLAKFIDSEIKLLESENTKIDYGYEADLKNLD